MGLKGAPSYFQQVMATEVLKGLLYIICELYIDDVLIYADSEQQLLEHMEMFFARCKEFNILINPDKCKLGYTEVEYVGHTLDGDGLHFSDEKLNGVDQLVLPQTPKGLESFLGLVNYFSSHVRNHSILTRPLRFLLAASKKTRKPVWTEEGNPPCYQRIPLKRPGF